MFRKKQSRSLPTSPQEYPLGTFVKTEAGYFYISTPNKRLRLISQRVLDSWSPPRIVETTEAALKNYKIWAKMGFRNGSLIHNIADGKIYLVAGNKRRHVTSPDALDRIGATRADVVSVSLTEINLQELGDELH